MWINRQFFQPFFNRLQISQRVAQPFEAVTSDKTAIYQPAHLRFNVRKPQCHGHIHPPFQTFVDIEHRSEDLLDLLRNIHHRVIQFGAHFFMQRSKAFFRPDRATIGINQLIHTAGDTVVYQLQHFAIRVKVQPKFGFVWQLLMQIFDWRWNIQQQ